MRLLMKMSVLGLLSVGCIQDLLDQAAELSPDSATASSSAATATSEPPTPTTSGGSGVQTVTGPSSGTTGAAGTTSSPDPETSTGMPEENAPPTVELEIDTDTGTDHLSEAGKALLVLTASADVIKVRLSMDGAPLADLTPADFPYTYEALSAKDNGDPHVFVVEVEDAEGLTATDDAELTVQLPASGAERCLFEDKTSDQSMISALVYTDAAIVAGGWRSTGAGPRAAIWKLDPDHCEVVLPGWPKTIANWSGDMNLAALSSLVSAIAVDDAGNLAVGVNLITNNKPQRHVAFLTSGGSLLWEKPGKPGEEVAGIAITPEIVAAVGSVLTSENPARTDAVLWRHLEGGSVWRETLKAPFTGEEVDLDLMNQRSEWARAVVYDPELGVLVVGGERELLDGDNKVYSRAFIARFVPLGSHYGVPWTSSGDPLKKDSATALARCGSEIVIGGWTQDWPPGSLPQPLTRWLAEDGTAEMRVVEQLSDAQTLGIACDREGKVVLAARRSLGEVNAQVFAFMDPKQPRLWYEKGVAGSDAAHTIDCDARGFCAWGGFRTVNGKSFAVVRGHHP